MLKHFSRTVTRSFVFSLFPVNLVAEPGGCRFTRKFPLLVLAAACWLVCGAANLSGQETGGADESTQDGFRPLFNGTDLTGWYAMETEDPRKFARLSAEEQQSRIKAARAATGKHWRVENQEIVNDGEGPFLTTDEHFSDFDFYIEYKTVPLADSGVYLKATPQVQIWDFTETAKFGLGADKGSGGLWNNSPGAPGKDPLVLADRPFGEWNELRIRQVGARTDVWLNGSYVVQGAVMENYWNRKLPLVRSGPIQLQTHGGEIRWRNARIKELTAEEANQILAENQDEGFRSIFNGADFSGWQGPLDNYQIQDGVILCKPGRGGTIFTEQEYGDFVVRFEFKLPPGGNNGLAIRYPGSGDTAYVGMCELQILDDDAPRYAQLDPRQYHGSAYGMVAAHRGYLRPTGEWNFQEVTVQGSCIKVELNGSVILDCDLSEVTEFMTKSPHPGKDRLRGHFGLAGHNDPVEFRNLRVKELNQAELD
jgi:hypothetical protein